MSIRGVYKDSCIGLGEEVSKVLRELANSIRSNRHFCRERLCKILHQHLQNLNSALKSQPQLFLGSRNGRTSIDTPPRPKNHGGEDDEEKLKRKKKKALKPQLSMIAMTSLELSDALPFAGFASLLVEMVAKLDHHEQTLKFRRWGKENDGRPPAHIVHYLKATGFYGMSRLSLTNFESSLVSALVERWRPRNTHLPPSTGRMHHHTGGCCITTWASV
ncbi:aluminum-activated malate transporter 12-like [Senna tora]|uniref:Aluminum-activated malate transporter 12-like n=1 Tax=Senna tora TaxID=362788 RepID=A0A834W6W1_9FABA|nr:aluminum-activated malate transporter 12-like [Senna tora]